MSASGCPAYFASAIPLRNAAACRRAQDDDAKHDPSPGTFIQRLHVKFKKVDTDPGHAPCRHVVAAQSHLAKNAKLSPANYLRAADAYMLISMPQGTSTIFGAFQAILALLVDPCCKRTTSPSPLN